MKNYHIGAKKSKFPLSVPNWEHKAKGTRTRTLTANYSKKQVTVKKGKKNNIILGIISVVID